MGIYKVKTYCGQTLAFAQRFALPWKQVSQKRDTLLVVK